GLGKSGIICKKVSATLASTGTPSFFLHPAEAIHGDLGMIVGGDIVVAISNSGETEELVRLLQSIKRIGAEIVAITGNPQSTLALGDALAMALLVRKGFKEEDFAFFHPGGKLGKRFLRVRDLMHADEAVPVVKESASMHDVIYEMSKKGFGIAAIASDDGTLAGVISDGDLRRLLQNDEQILKKTAG